MRFHIVADAAERRGLAERFGLRSLDRMEVDLSLVRLKGGSAMRVEGRLQADLVQSCVVTLDPVSQHVDEPFCLDFGEVADVVDATSGDLLISAEDEDVEPMPATELDVGELAAEQLALAIDPYPRKEGADLEAVLKQHGLRAEAGKSSPFAVLATLKDKN